MNSSVVVVDDCLWHGVLETRGNSVGFDQVPPVVVIRAYFVFCDDQTDMTKMQLKTKTGLKLFLVARNEF